LTGSCSVIVRGIRLVLATRTTGSMVRSPMATMSLIHRWAGSAVWKVITWTPGPSVRDDRPVGADITPS
jgi:hypothetical protein